MEQKAIDYITAARTRHITLLERNGGKNVATIRDLILETGKAFLGETGISDGLISRIKAEDSFEVDMFVSDVLSPRNDVYGDQYPWTIEHPVIQTFIQRKHFISRFADGPSTQIENYLQRHLVKRNDADLAVFIPFLHRQGFTDEDIVSLCAVAENCFYAPSRLPVRLLNDWEHVKNGTPTRFTTYLISFLKPSTNQADTKKRDSIKQAVDLAVFAGHNNAENRTAWLNVLLEYFPEGIKEGGKAYDGFFVTPMDESIRKGNTQAMHLLLDRDAARYEPLILDAMERIKMDGGDRYELMLTLYRKLGRHRDYIIENGEKVLQSLRKPDQAPSHFKEWWVFGLPMSAAYLDFLFLEDARQANEKLKVFYQDAPRIDKNFLKYTESKLGADALPLLVSVLKKDAQYELEHYYYTRLFQLLEKHDLKPYREAIIDFAVNSTVKTIRELACTTLSKISGILDDAQQLLNGKTVNQRITATLILSRLEIPEATVVLNDAIEKESNDDIRDIMIEALLDQKFKEPYTLGQVKDMLRFAAERKKLSKWNEKTIDETKLPKLYLKGEEDPLNEQAIRFLFYRMKRARGLNSDIEARQLLNHIDRDRSQAFARALLTAFQDSGSDSKLRYYLTLAALLGDDELMHTLNTLFKKNIADKRVKMAEYIVSALAMIGSDKALRLVEVIYRKFANKKPTLSTTAREALDAAARELNLTMDELADKIIPNFDFEGIYKTFTVDGEEYRAFINSDFKLSYFTEDNKVRKSLPTGAPKELKAEFKDIEKEVNDVVKSQSGRLEKYMIEERRWPVEHWQTFFFNNPIMFVYALKLLWGVYDKDGRLINTFYCSEDTSQYDVNDEEVTLEEGQYVGILHPAQMSGELLNVWKDKTYAMSMVTIFPILERTIFTIPAAERDSNFTKTFFERDIPKGADFVNTFLVKRNWHKGTGDGGHSQFTKLYKDGLIRAYADIEGPSAWYQGGNTPAKMYNISFQGKSWSDQVPLKNVPPVFYSEILADIDLMINAN